VMPPGSQYRMMFGTVDVIRPLAVPHYFYDSRTVRGFSAFARLQPGTTIAQASAELPPIAARLAHDHPELNKGHEFRLQPLNESANDDVYRGVYWLLLGLSVFVLLIACANLANLQLARTMIRARELAIRAALGASRLTLIRHQLVENLILSLLGGGLGLIVAAWICRLLEQSISWDGDHWLELPITGGIFVFTLGVAVLTGLLFGLAPAWLATRADVGTLLKQQARGSSRGGLHQRARHALIVGEIGLALVLLAAAGVMVGGMNRLLAGNPGWDASQVLTATLTLPESTRYNTDPIKREFHRQLEARLAALPGVEHVAFVTGLPIDIYGSTNPLKVEGLTPELPSEQPLARYTMATHDYLEALKIPLREGRFFGEDIRADSPPVSVVNEALARHFWPHESAIGKRIAGLEKNEKVWREIIGVVGDVEAPGSMRAPATPYQVYSPLAHDPWGFFYIVVRGPAVTSLGQELQRAVAEIDPDLALEHIWTIPQAIYAQQHDMIVVGRALTAFALLGVVLAVIGLYGLVSSLVAQRTVEFGIRMALGARPRDVLTQVVLWGVRLSAVGLVLGGIGALAVGHWLSTLLPRLDGTEPFRLLAVAGALFGVTLLACWVPARRATKVDPLVALRAE